MVIQDEIKRNSKEFEILCRNHKVKKLFAFGSGVTSQFDSVNSDFDFLVELDITDPIEKGETLLSLWDKFELFFNRKVDLLTNTSLRNPYLKREIESTRKLIYDGSGKKIPGRYYALN